MTQEEIVARREANRRLAEQRYEDCQDDEWIVPVITDTEVHTESIDSLHCHLIGNHYLAREENTIRAKTTSLPRGNAPTKKIVRIGKKQDNPALVAEQAWQERVFRLRDEHGQVRFR